MQGANLVHALEMLGHHSGTDVHSLDEASTQLQQSVSPFEGRISCTTAQSNRAKYTGGAIHVSYCHGVRPQFYQNKVCVVVYQSLKHA